jgi:hypothetical protein
VPRNPGMSSTLRRRLVDEAMDAYVDWREECVRVWDAYHRWLDAVRADAALAFRAYLAALDREERASEVYAGRLSRLDPLVATPGQGATEDRASASGAS